MISFIRYVFHLSLTIAILFVISLHPQSASAKLLLFSGAASKPATEEVIKALQEKFRIPADVIFGGSGFVLSQMKLSRRGDIYFPGSSDFMELAKREGLVYPESEKIVAYLVPALNVQKGNPRGIRS